MNPAQQLQLAIINVITCYDAIGGFVRPGSHSYFDDIPRRFNNLYAAIDALKDAFANDTGDTAQPGGCGGYICHCSRYNYTHFHENGCTCEDEGHTPAENGAAYLDAH